MAWFDEQALDQQLWNPNAPRYNPETGEYESPSGPLVVEAPTPPPEVATPTPEPAAATPAGSADPFGFTRLFRSWYGHAPSADELADFTRQAQSAPGASSRVFQNLYRNSPAYDPAYPYYYQAHPQAPSTPAGGGTGGGGTGHQTLTEAEFRRTIAGYPDNPAGLRKWVADHPEYGVQVVGSSGGDLQFPDGSIVDVGLAFAAGGGQGYGWMPATGGAGGAGSLLQPFGQEFSYPGFAPPPEFVAPTPEEALNDPGFQFRLQEGLQAIERSAAARGTLATGGTLKALTQYGQGLASEEYGNVYARRVGEYESRYGKRIGEWETAYNKALGEYLNAFNIFNVGQSNTFNRLAALAGVGQQSANALMGAGADYSHYYGDIMGQSAAQQGGYLTSSANANAAASVASGNAYADWLGTAGSTALDLGMMNYLRNRGRSSYRRITQQPNLYE